MQHSGILDCQLIKPLNMTVKQPVTFCLIAIVFIINACCKAECIGRTVNISFFKLRAINTDSISVISYTPGSNHTQKIDSNFIHSPVAANDTSYSRLYQTVYSEHDWKIINHSLNTEYRLNNFETEKVKCCGEKAVVVRSFSLNGVRKQGDYLELD
jgi:hypothetical protein